MITERAILNKLRSLGVTEYAVYISLKAKRIKGKKGTPAQCPVANFLREEFPSANMCTVGITTCAVDKVHVGQPQAVAKFRRSFDYGSYPDLEQVRTPSLILPSLPV